MPQRQQDSVCAQIIPCSSWLFSIFLNRHCTESGVRNGPVISLIASTDKSKWVNFFKDTTDSNPKCSSSSSQPSLPQWCGPPRPALIPRLGKNPNGRKGSPSRQDPSPPSEGQHSERKAKKSETACSWASVLLLPWSWPQVWSRILHWRAAVLPRTSAPHNHSQQPCTSFTCTHPWE